MSETAQLISALNELKKTITDEGGLSTGNNRRTSTSINSGDSMKDKLDEIRANKAIKDSNVLYGNSINKNTKVMKRLNEIGASSVTIYQTANNQMNELIDSTSNLDAAAANYKDNIKDISPAIAGMINGFDDMYRVTQAMDAEKLAVAKKAMDKWQAIDAKDIVNKKKAREAYNAELQKLKLSHQELNTILREGPEIHDALQSEVAKTADSMHSTITSFADAKAKLGKSIGAISAFTAALYGAARPTISVGKSAAKTGMEFNLLSFMMGMNHEELNMMQKENIQSLRASNMSFDDFNEIVKTSGEGLTGFTGDMGDSMRVAAQSMSIAKEMGVGEAERNSYMAKQQEIFKDLNTTLGMTAEEFMSMRNQLKDSAAVQTQIYKLNRSQRAAHMQDLLLTQKGLMIEGLSQEAALKTVEAMEQIGGKSAKDRIKDAAKLQATMGAMGLGAQGARAAELLRGGLRGRGDKSEFADLMKQAQQATSTRMGGGLASELMTGQLIESAGVGEYLGPGSEFAQLNTKQELAVGQTAQNTAAIRKKAADGWSDAMTYHDQMLGIVTGTIGQTVGGILAILGTISAGIFGIKVLTGKLFTSNTLGFKGITSTLGGISKILGKVLGKGLAGALLYVAYEAGHMLGTWIYDKIGIHIVDGIEFTVNLLSDIWKSITSLPQQIGEWILKTLPWTSDVSHPESAAIKSKELAKTAEIKRKEQIRYDMEHPEEAANRMQQQMEKREKQNQKNNELQIQRQQESIDRLEKLIENSRGEEQDRLQKLLQSINDTLKQNHEQLMKNDQKKLNATKSITNSPSFPVMK